MKKMYISPEVCFIPLSAHTDILTTSSYPPSYPPSRPNVNSGAGTVDWGLPGGEEEGDF